MSSVMHPTSLATQWCFVKDIEAVYPLTNMTWPMVLPLSVVDNSAFSLNGLTLPIDLAYPSC